MSSQRAASEDLANRVTAIEDELASQRRALAALARRAGAGDLDSLIDELADVPMTEEEMEAAFSRLDVAVDAAR